MIHKRGYGTVDKRRVALNDNRVIEEAIGESTGMICVEDIVHEVFNVGPHFQEVRCLLPVSTNAAINCTHGFPD